MLRKSSEIIKQQSAFPSFPRFPSLFSSNVWDGFWNDFDTTMGDVDRIWQSSTVPHDVIQHKDESGNIVATEMKYALAGFDKSDIMIEVDDNELCIKVERSEETKEEDAKKEYLHRGLAKRRMEWSYVLNNRVDRENITSVYENGMLKVKVPLFPQKEVKTIEVK